MYIIVPRSDKKTVLAKTATVDAAIVVARDLSRTICDAIVVRKGEQIRVIAVNGRAHWAVPCAPCKGTGQETGTIFANGWGSTVNCLRCCGAGVIADLQCE
jgi:hypothetical protein